MTGEAPGTGAQAPLVLALDDPDAVPEVVGGKGASLARLARAGVRVPPGFHVTTADGAGTLETETPAGLRSTPVLSPAQAGELGTRWSASRRVGSLPISALSSVGSRHSTRFRALIFPAGSHRALARRRPGPGR